MTMNGPEFASYLQDLLNNSSDLLFYSLHHDNNDVVVEVLNEENKIRLHGCFNLNLVHFIEHLRGFNVRVSLEFNAEQLSTYLIIHYGEDLSLDRSFMFTYVLRILSCCSPSVYWSITALSSAYRRFISFLFVFLCICLVVLPLFASYRVLLNFFSVPLDQVHCYQTCWDVFFVSMDRLMDEWRFLSNYLPPITSIFLAICSFFFFSIIDIFLNQQCNSTNNRFSVR